MTNTNLRNPATWASAFGLADAPLFAGNDSLASSDHRVMLDGGHGTFALSISDAEATDPAQVASWTWSSDIPHHVAVGSDRITVTRWDRAFEPRHFSPSSVQARFDSFYRFLVRDRVEQGQTVVDHLIEQFRSVRTAVNHAQEPDERSLGVFLALLAYLIGRHRSPTSTDADFVGVDDDAKTLFFHLRDQQLAPLIERARHQSFSRTDLDLYSTLAIRHAGGLIFQEAHFELMRAPSPNLFGFLDAPTVRTVKRGGAHFTPPALARSIVEQALSQIEGLQHREELTLADPACGSGAFLHEALRALQRAGFNGRVNVVGRDLSSHATAMATFVLAQAARDWSPVGGINIDVRTADSLQDGAFPKADIIVMNPPFVAVGDLDIVQRDHIDRILGPLKKGRPDLSMAFVLHAVDMLKPGGALGCLFPASLVELQSATPWRRALHERAQLKFLGLLGDHGLFAYALVQIAAAVFSLNPAEGDDQVLTLWTDNDKEVTGEALRALRSVSRKGPVAAENRETWRLAWVPSLEIKNASSWRLRAPQADRLIRDISETTLSRVTDLFDVRQGMLTGANEILIIGADEWKDIPESEQRYFLPAVMNKSIEDATLAISTYVFYPYSNGQHIFTTESELASAVPEFYRRKLLPHRDTLAARPSVARRRGEFWWSLAERRAWTGRREPRLITKYFGGVGAFVPDVDARVAVVQGYAWYPTSRLSSVAKLLPANRTSPNLIAAYGALLNTRVFARLLENFAPKVAGGQFNLSNRYVENIPLPDLPQIALDAIDAPAVEVLDRLGLSPRVTDQTWMDTADKAAARLYNVPLEAWV